MKQISPRVILLAIMTLFILPLALAWILYTNPFRGQMNNSGNLGRLVLPIVPLQWTGASIVAPSNAHQTLEGFWVIIYILPPHCEEPCLKQVAELRQLHRATGRNRDRVKIVLLSEPAFDPLLRHDLLSLYSGFNLASLPSAEFAGSLRQADHNSSPAGSAAVFYLVDPLGNIMMTYSGDEGPGKMSKDLKTLLTWSKLDERI